MDIDVNSPIQPAGTDPNSPATPSTAGGATVIKRRAPIACRRCRRMRSKCLHDKAKPPCQSCAEAGLGPESCIFPVRGQPDNDRDYRHPRMRAEKAAAKRDSAKMRRDIMDAPIIHSGVPLPPSSVKGVDEWDFLPPLPDIIDAVNKFTQNYFQLGFIPKQSFPERLRRDHKSVSVFLLLGILSVSARFTPSLVERYGSGMKAAEMFMDRASVVALSELYQVPSLERCQAFYLLSIAQQGSGLKNKSYINMGIAMRMAALMRLHREETYTLHNPSIDLIIASESARRTLWMLHSQDNLHSGPSSPVSLTASDITALLPCSEAEFAKGQEPKSRAALEDTPPAIENPKLVSDPGRSLFATLIQTHYFWGRVSRRAVKYDRSSQPWEPTSEYAELVEKLRDWEGSLPNEHVWSPLLLKGYKAEGQDLAYLGVTNATRLCNIVIRKAHLNDMINIEQAEPQLQAFWSNMSLELFSNVKMLHEQIDTQFMDRAPEDSLGAQMALFCVFSCGHMATYLCRYPNICPDQSIARDGTIMVQRAMTILAEAQQVWPLASRWFDSLDRFTRDNKGMLPGTEGSMADGRDPIPQALHPPLPQSPARPGPNLAASSEERQQRRSSEISGTTVLPAPSTVPTPMMYIDPNMRLPAPAPGSQPQTQEQAQQAHHQAIAPIPHQQQQQLGGRSTTDGLGLLIEAFDTHQGGGHLGPQVTVGQPYDSNVTAQHPGYYGQPGTVVPGNDGYENELQFYIDGAPNVQSWVGGGYGY